MCRISDEIYAEGYAEGFAEGYIQGLDEARVEKTTIVLRYFVEEKGFTPERAVAACDVPANEKEYFLELLRHPLA